jgi:hypothetical protein
MGGPGTERDGDLPARGGRWRKAVPEVGPGEMYKTQGLAYKLCLLAFKFTHAGAIAPAPHW